MIVKEMDILEAAYENHRADVERREADYMRELNTKLAQINAQAKMIKALVDALVFIRDNANEGVLKAVATDTLEKIGKHGSE